MEKFFSINNSGYSVRCKIYCNDIHNIKRIVVFGHGFGGHKDNRAAARFANAIMSKYKDFATITFDWPCHGEDARKKLRLEECDAYLTFVLDYIKSTYSPNEIFGYATSFGGYIFLKYLSDHGSPFNKIALRCPAVNMYSSTTERIMSDNDKILISKGKEALVGFDRKIKIDADFLSELQSTDITQNDYIDFADDIIVIHGTKDEVIPFELVKDFSEENLFEFIPVEDADHRFQNQTYMDAAINYIIKFFTDAS